MSWTGYSVVKPRILGTYLASLARAEACPLCPVCAQYVSGMAACDARLDVPFNCPHGVEKHVDELSGTGEIGKMRRAKPISMKPGALSKHKNPFKLRQIPALVRDLTSGVAQARGGQHAA